MEDFIVVVNPDFKGRTQTFLNKDGKCIYTGKSLEEMRKEDGIEYITPDDQTMDKMWEEYYKSIQGKWEDITEERYYEMLDVLPPMNWRNIGKGVEVFCICEAFTGHLHHHYVKYSTDGEKVFKSALRSRFIKGDEILKELNLI